MSNLAALLSAKRDNALLSYAALSFCVWLAWTGPIRWHTATFLPTWLLGSAPNLFAGLTLTFWQAFIVPSRPLASAVVALLVLAAVEAIQIPMPQHRADGWDVLASAAGCTLATLVLSWRKRLAKHALQQ